MKRSFYVLIIFALLLQPALSFLPGASAQQGGNEPQAPADVTLYVKPVAMGTGNCSSWANACELQIALGAAIPDDEIWVQAGTYKPTAGAVRTATFALKSGVAIYGGFAGTETSRAQRNWVTNVTTLSGDIGVAGNNSDNSYHVVTGSSVDGTAILDGFTITLGNANASFPDNSGGGMFNDESSPALTNVTFIENTANNGGGMRNNDHSNPRLSGVTFNANHAVSGGGIYNESSSPRLITVTLEANTATWGGGMTNGESSSPILTNTLFIDNISSSDGGGMVNTSSSSPVLTDVTFSGNTAQTGTGGGMNNDHSSAVLTNVTFLGNTAAMEGGGMKNFHSNPSLIDVNFIDNEAGWGAGISNQESSPPLINAVFLGNTAAQDGGAIHNYNASSPVLINVTLADNSANRGGGMDSWDSSDPDLTNTILWGNTATQGAQIYNPGSSLVDVSYSLVEGGCPTGVSCDHLLSVNPQFVDAAGGDLRLQPTSPAIDAGDNTAVPLGVLTDLNGSPRFVDILGVPDTGAGGPPIVDMGAYEARIIFVDLTAPGPTHDGTSWANAFNDLQAALAAARVGNHVWVADGTYRPTSGADRAATFALKSGVAIYGGFLGTETSLNQRNLIANVTILSGDIGVAGNSDNSYHVVTGSSVDGTAILDGFTVTGGNANASSPDDSGGGMYNHYSSPALANVTFSGNTATYLGGGMYNYYSNPALANVTFSGNTASDSGGGMFNRYSSPALANVTFSGNTALNYGGGGMYNSNSSSPVLTDVIFSGNAATWGGGMYNFDSNPALANVTFSGNTATNGGGGMRNYDSSPALANVTFSGNTATNGGGMYNINSSSPVLANAILWGNTPDQIYNEPGSTPAVTYSDIQGGYAGTGNINADPRFVNAAGGDLRLQPTSPAIDAGNNAAVPLGVLTDLNGSPRFVDIPGVLDPGAIVDMGAYEVQLAVYLPVVSK